MRPGGKAQEAERRAAVKHDDDDYTKRTSDMKPRREATCSSTILVQTRQLGDLGQNYRR